MSLAVGHGHQVGLVVSFPAFHLCGPQFLESRLRLVIACGLGFQSLWTMLQVQTVMALVSLSKIEH